jgi:hypothetical protein
VSDYPTVSGTSTDSWSSTVPTASTNSPEATDSLEATDSPERIESGIRGEPEAWMHRDDEFLFDADRDYVLRDDARSVRAWVSPVLFGLGVAVLVGDAVTIGLGTALGLETTHPIAAPVVVELGVRGLVLLKATAAILLVLLPGVTESAPHTARAGLAALVAVGLFAAAANIWAVAVAI